MNYSPEPSERFRRKYFLWMCLRESAYCRRKTKRGAIGFPTFHGVLVSEHPGRSARVLVMNSERAYGHPADANTYMRVIICLFVMLMLVFI